MTQWSRLYNIIQKFVVSQIDKENAKQKIKTKIIF